NGPPIVTVPSVKGTEASTARALLLRRGFKPEVILRFSQTVQRDEVISQTPPAKAQVQYGAAVKLIVSRGPQPVKVPDLRGRSADDASATLRAVGFEVERIDRFSDTVPRGDVIRQHPASGTAPKGSTVTI